LRALRCDQISRLRRLLLPSQRKGGDATGVLCTSLRTTYKAMGGAAGSYPQQTRENAQSVGEKRVNVEGRKIVDRKKPRGISPRGCLTESTIRLTSGILIEARFYRPHAGHPRSPSSARRSKSSRKLKYPFA
jgi:hypothetical protein